MNRVYVEAFYTDGKPRLGNGEFQGRMNGSRNSYRRTLHYKAIIKKAKSGIPYFGVTEWRILDGNEILETIAIGA